MRRLSLGIGMLLALSAALSAQVSSVSIQQNLTSATCPGSGCIALAVSGYGGIALQITGTYSGTVSFEGSVDGVTFTALNLTPTNSTTAATSTTSTGVWSGGMGGLTSVRARMSSYTSGTASVVLQAAPTAARGGSGGGGSGAPTDATYITQTADSTLSAEQALAALATGILKSTTTTGVVSIATAGTDYVAPLEYAAGNSSTALTVNWTNGSQQTVTLTDNATFTFSNPHAGARYLLVLSQDGTGSRTVTWPATVKWASGTAPTLTATASAVDVCTFAYTAASSGIYLSACNLDLR